MTLDQNVPLDVPLDDSPCTSRTTALIAFLKAMEFSTLTRRIAEKTGIDASAIEADAKLVRRDSTLRLQGRRSAPHAQQAPSAGDRLAFGARPPLAGDLPPQGERSTRRAPSPPSRSPPRAPKHARSAKIDRPNTNACARSTGSSVDRARA